MSFSERAKATALAIVKIFETTPLTFCSVASIFTGSKGALNIPSELQSRPNSLVVNVKFFAPIRERLGRLVDSEVRVAGSVILLNLTRCPSAIFGRVVVVYVFAVNRVLRSGRLAHVRKEILKRIPSLTDFYSASTVVFIVLIIASGTNAFPNQMEASTRLAVACTMFLAILVAQASATFGGAGSETIGSNVCNLPAITQAFPPTVLIFSTKIPLNNESPKALPINILEIAAKGLGVESGKMRSSHSAFSFSKSGLIRLVREVQTLGRAVSILLQNPFQIEVKYAV